MITFQFWYFYSNFTRDVKTFQYIWALAVITKQKIVTSLEATKCKRINLNESSVPKFIHNSDNPFDTKHKQC